MIHHRHAIMRGNPNPQQNNRVRQHPVAQYLMQQFVEDDPVMYRVLDVLAGMASYGVRITPDLIDRVIATHRRVDAYMREGVIARHARPTLPYKPHPGARQARFADIDIKDPVVYYARIGNRVKIGTSTDLASRMREINPEELMVAEYGGQPTEYRRHQQFKHLRTHGEWFRLEGELVEHIEQLKSQLGPDV